MFPPTSFVPRSGNIVRPPERRQVPAEGVIADNVGIHHAFVLPVLCYLYILFNA